MVFFSKAETSRIEGRLPLPGQPSHRPPQGSPSPNVLIGFGQADGDGVRVRSGNRPDDLRSVRVVFGVIGSVDVALERRVGGLEGDVALNAAGRTLPSAAALARRYHGLPGPYADRT